MAEEPVEARFEAARQFAMDAGKLTLKYFQTDDFKVERKSDQSPVTIADRAAEQLLREKISEHFPTDAIVGEEFGESPGTSGFRWILDPIDGTKSFINGVPLYGTMIGVEHDHECQIGAVYIPGLDEGIFASVGVGCFHKIGAQAETKAKVSTQPLSDGLFVTSEVSTFSQRNSSQVYAALEDAAYVSRSWGDCYGYLLVATGRAVLMVDPILNIWDAAAVKPIIEEAGGHFVDWNGTPTIHSGEAVGCNKTVLDEVLAITRTAE